MTPNHDDKSSARVGSQCSYPRDAAALAALLLLA